MTRIAFTSCSRISAFPNQPVWDDILREDPDALVLLGDQIYMDFGLWPFSHDYNGSPQKLAPKDFEKVMRAKYTAQWSEPNFASLISRMRERSGLYAIWDDHDFAWNGATGDYVPTEIKEISRGLFNEFIYQHNCQRPLYQSVDIGPAHLILLDTRFYSEKPCKRTPSMHPLLGDDQAAFLQKTLKHDREYTIIASGITLSNGGENWKKYKPDYEFLRGLLKERKNSIFISGDIHQNKYHKPRHINCHELISSGAAINYLGLPIGYDDNRNWALLDCNNGSASVQFFSNKSRNRMKKTLL